MTRIRLAWIALGALWIGEVTEAIWWPSFLSPSLDQLADVALGVLSAGVILWALADRYLRPHAEIERREHLARNKVGSVFAVLSGLSERSGVPVADLHDTQPVLRVADERDTA